MPIPNNYIKNNRRLFRFLSNDATEAEDWRTPQIDVNIQVDGNYGTPEEFYIQPPTGYLYEMYRLLILIRDNVSLTSDDYIAAGALTNGIQTQIGPIGAPELELPIPIKTIHDYAALAGTDVKPLDINSSKSWAIRWTFEKSGKPLFLNSLLNERFCLIANDNFTSLTHHTFLVQGIVHTTDVSGVAP